MVDLHHDSSSSDTASRVARLETTTEALARDIASLTSDVRTITRLVQEQSSSIERQIRDYVVGSTKTDWQAWLTAALVALAVGTAAMSPVYWRLDSIGDQVLRVDDGLLEHTRLTLHPVGRARIDGLERRFDSAIAELRKEARRHDSILTELRVNDARQSNKSAVP